MMKIELLQVKYHDRILWGVPFSLRKTKTR
jgi:hypothetical protein